MPQPDSIQPPINALAARRSLIAALIASFLPVAAAVAQSEQGNQDGEAELGNEPIELQSVVVQGQKIDRDLQDTVSSVKVFDLAEIDEQGYTDLYDVLDQTANVFTAFDDSVISIRGIRNIGAGLGDATSDVSTIYVDGVFIPRSLFQNGSLNLWDVSAVEIFRGPQSTVQGRNALAGAIVVRTSDPDPEFSGRAQVSYADFSTWRASAAASVPLGDQA
ncbi:MAG: TonB-dependent receptor plug domain-containing protein [Pseudomonadota bacterium]